MSGFFCLLIVLAPLLATLLIGSLHLLGLISGEAGEKYSAKLALAGISLAFLSSLTLALQATEPVYRYFCWLEIGRVQIEFGLFSGGFNLALANLFAGLILLVMRFSVNYMHREAGFHRWFFTLSLFATGMMLIVLSSNAVFSFVGWELAGVCSYWLIAYAYDRPQAANNATRVFLTNRIGDGGFLFAMALALSWLGSADWLEINARIMDLSPADRHGLAACFVLAAMAKSAQIPFTPWLARALEGPTPSSALFYGGVMIHSGVFLLIQLQPVLESARWLMVLLLVVGGLTSAYSWFVGLTQTDVKSGHGFAISGQLGLMFVECGLGFWQLASWHLAAHAVVRCYLLLTAPSILHVTAARPVQPVWPGLRHARWAFMASLQRGWLEPLLDALLVKPVQQFSKDMLYVDKHIIKPVFATPVPVITGMANLAQSREDKIGANLQSVQDSFAQGSGLAGKLTQWLAALMNGFEEHFILFGIGRNSIRFGRRLGHVANRFERLLLKPRFISLFVLICLLVALGS